MFNSAAKVSLRLIVLMTGLFIYGLGIALMVTASIGIAPWDVLAQGISKQAQVSYGVASIIVSILVMLTWIPLKVKVGIGSVLNAICIGLFTDLWMPWLPSLDLWAPADTTQHFALQLAQYLLGMLIVAFATGLYISSNFGTGPRDGLIIGLRKKYNKPVWLIRTVTESLVLLIGWLLGGQVGLGTILFAFGIGYLMQLSLLLFKIDRPKA